MRVWLLARCLVLLLLAPPALGSTLLVVGDSISAGFALDTQQGWVDLLGERLKQQGSDLEVVNASISGDTSAGGLARLPALLAEHRPALVIIELGGNDAAIVLDDVNPAQIAPKLFFAAMVNSGQVCLAAKRIFVPEKIYDAVCAELGKIASAAKVGNGLEEGVERLVFGRVELVGPANPNPLGVEHRKQVVVPGRVLPTDEFVTPPGNLQKLRERSQALRRNVLRLQVVVQLRLQAGDPDLEELVQVRRRDRQKPDPVE